MKQLVIACDWPYEIRVGVTFPLSYQFAEVLNERHACDTTGGWVILKNTKRKVVFSR